MNTPSPESTLITSPMWAEYLRPGSFFWVGCACEFSSHPLTPLVGERSKIQNQALWCLPPGTGDPFRVKEAAWVRIPPSPFLSSPWLYISIMSSQPSMNFKKTRRNQPIHIGAVGDHQLAQICCLSFGGLDALPPVPPACHAGSLPAELLLSFS